MKGILFLLNRCSAKERSVELRGIALVESDVEKYSKIRHFSLSNASSQPRTNPKRCSLRRCRHLAALVRDEAVDLAAAPLVIGAAALGAEAEAAEAVAAAVLSSELQAEEVERWFLGAPESAWLAALASEILVRRPDLPPDVAEALEDGVWMVRGA